MIYRTTFPEAKYPIIRLAETYAAGRSEWGKAKAAPEGMTTGATRGEDARSDSRWGGHESSHTLSVRDHRGLHVCRTAYLSHSNRGRPV